MLFRSDVEDAQFLAHEIRADLVEVGHHDEAVRHRQENHVRGLHQPRDAHLGKAIEGLGLGRRLGDYRRRCSVGAG